MDIFNFAKAIEQGIYDVMMWIFFYPYTLLRMLIFPAATLKYVFAEAAKEPDTAFAEAMRPALFIFISIVLGTLIAPLSADQTQLLQQTRVGSLVIGSWFVLVFYRMVAFSFFPLVGAVLTDLRTPGNITRDTLRRPFYLQCYICAPFALIASPTLVNVGHESTAAYLIFAAVTVWFVAVQAIYFRDYARAGLLHAAGLAFGVLLLGSIGQVLLGLTVLA